MFEKFGEFDNYEEINKAADGLKAEGDLDSLKLLAEENGIDPEDVEDYIDGEIDELTTAITAALGKIEIESRTLGLKGILEDWRDYIQSKCLGIDGSKWQKAVRAKGKSLSGCLGKLIEYSFKNQYEISEELVNDLKKTAGVNAGRITSGTPSMAKAREIIQEYYLGGAKA